MTENPMQWRAMRPDDVDSVDAIAAVVHVNFPEPKAVFANRQAQYPDGCMILEQAGDDGPRALGYMIAHPWPMECEPPALGALVDQMPDSDALYLHDVAILADARGSGAGGAALRHLMDLARRGGFSRIWLTAVDGADRYWAQKAFHRVGDDAPYGEGTMVMEYILGDM
ncbi:GNAT family N-acetyltransferase [Sphingopyxis yananensis]|uniref:GNAT family N-acetyltransferase n=1 Tax=Sphingopyxis yananensis TaxID=2886687 RepID=UPI001D10F789|nr:GNAT family N-acetyltransferase [Sphingopyxis yananensis]MCC2602616.1 GNAT family N-acetyltransferase [Sphingopyxis yananensis]